MKCLQLIPLVLSGQLWLGVSLCWQLLLLYPALVALLCCSGSLFAAEYSGQGSNMTHGLIVYSGLILYTV